MRPSPRPLVTGFTIDPLDACELDDAIDICKRPQGWHLAVSVVDVAAHVQAGSDEDQQAYQRAFTRYFDSRREPMLPQTLAEERLSLLPEQLRDTLTFTMDFNTRLEVIRLDIQQTQLGNEAQLTYDDVSEILDTPSHTQHVYWREALELAEGLFKQRQQRGALAIFDLGNALRSTEEGKLLRLSEGSSHQAYLIVQECMIAANHSVTAYLLEQGVPLLFRNQTSIHEDIREQYLSELQPLLRDPSAEMIEQINHHLARLLDRAHYSPVNQGHVGLNLSCYAHWTSPLRRYADLVNHHLLRAWLHDQALPYGRRELELIGAHLDDVVGEMRQQRILDKQRAKAKRLRQDDETTLAALESKEMTSLIESLASGQIEWCASRVAEIERRLSDDALTISDITRLLFAPSTQALCSELKQGALRWLTGHSARVFQVFDLGHRFYGWPAGRQLEWEEGQRGSGHMQTFWASVSVVHEGHRLISQTAACASKQEAKQWALLSLLSRLAGLDWGLPKWVSEAVQSAASPPSNPKGILLEIAQAFKEAAPVLTLSVEGPVHQPSYTCVGALQLSGVSYTSAPHRGTSKKKSERLAALDILGQLPEAVVKYRTDKFQLTPEKNPISLLQEWSTQYACELPLYSFDSSGPPHAPMFICTCEVSTVQGVKLWQGVGVTKKAAKAQAAEAACETLLSEMESMSDQYDLREEAAMPVEG